MADEVRAPDAFLFHNSLKVGATVPDRLASIRQRLGTPPSPEHWFTYDVGGGWSIAVPGIRDSLLYPKDHPRSGESRYDWVDAEPTLKCGYLKPE